MMGMIICGYIAKHVMENKWNSWDDPIILVTTSCYGGYPLVNIQKAIENGHRNSEFSH